MTRITRRTFLAAAPALALARPARAQAARIEFLGWSNEEAPSKPSIEHMMRSFEQANPGASVSWVGFQWADVQRNLLLRLRANQVPDIVQIQDRWLPSLARLPQMADLNDVFGKAELEKFIDPGLLAMGRIRGKQMGMPWCTGTVGMVANKKVLDEAGVGEIPATVDAFVAALRKVKQKNANAVPYPMSTKNNGSIYLDAQIWMWTFGATYLDDNAAVKVNSPQALQALEFLVSLVKDGLAVVDIDRPDARRLFAQEQSAMYFDAPVARSFARQMSGKGEAYDVNVIPTSTPVLKAGDSPRAAQWGHVVSLMKKGDAVPKADSAAAKFLLHLTTNPDIQVLYYKNVGLFPTARASLGRQEIASDPYASRWLREATRADRAEVANWDNAVDLTNVIGEETQAAMLGQKTPAAAVAAMAQRLEPLMAKNR
ncbi:MAG: sugar ABC transporter substrate-binding protein [Alphaproteobacteria bacterium]|nr:sugar ABC transporter substrate-binding protein [Alphaproteobacteria bacterium]